MKILTGLGVINWNVQQCVKGINQLYTGGVDSRRIDIFLKSILGVSDVK